MKVVVSISWAVLQVGIQDEAELLKLMILLAGIGA